MLLSIVRNVLATLYQSLTAITQCFEEGSTFVWGLPFFVYLLPI